MPAEHSRDVRRVVASSYLGSTVEFYDFILIATASSVVFGPVFFADQSPGIALIASYATFAIGYLSRPLGGIVFGHFGYRIGRKKMLMLSMSIMGVASSLIGFLPAVSPWGALMLVPLRAVQGIAIGGEWGGAALMSLEHVKGRHRQPPRRGLHPRHRRLYAGFGTTTVVVGYLIAGCALSAVVLGFFVRESKDADITQEGGCAAREWLWSVWTP